MVDGEVVEDLEDDVESGNNTCCECFNSAAPGTSGCDQMIDIVPEEKLNLEEGEVTEVPGDDLKIRKAENEAETIVRELIDTVITDIIM